MSEKYNKIFEEFKNNNKREIFQVGKILGRGAFGEVRDVTYKNKVMAGKVIEKDEDEQTQEEKFVLELRGFNLIKMNKIYTRKINNKYYDLIIMEKAILRDLGKLNEYFHRHNLLKLIYEDPFDEKSGDYLLKFYAKQIINGLETLDRNDFVHFDIKPENLLVTVNLIRKLSDFNILRKVNSQIKSEKIKLPGGTPGYMTPEYYINKYVTSEDAKKQDYFALGACLFILKYGVQLLKFKKYDDSKMNYDRIISLLEKNIAYIKSQKCTDKNFMNFLIKLIMYTPDERPSFEQIYRNKWLNENSKELDQTIMAFENDEEKLIMELQKQDFLVKKENIIQKEGNQYKFRFKKKLIKKQ
jgi:serine/threonine protein kinase